MEVVYKQSKSKSKKEPYWRVSAGIPTNSEKIVIEIENFEYGFRDGESWDKVATFNTFSGSNQKEQYVTVITKHAEKIEEFKKLTIDKLYEVLNFNMKDQISVVRRSVQKLEYLKRAINSEIFQDSKDKVDSEKSLKF